MESRELCSIFIFIIFGFDSFGWVQSLGEDDTITERTCEGSLFSIKCPDNSTINVISANYGRTSSLYCPGPNSESTADCFFDTSLRIVREECQGKNICNILATNSVFDPDPCRGVYKYLEVIYICVRNRVTCNDTNCSETTEVCVDDGVNDAACECAENYTADTNGICRAVSCNNSGSRCGDTEICEDLSPGIQCACPREYLRATDNSCVAVSCDNSRSSCENTEICEDLSPGIQCVCAEDYLRLANNSCVAVSCNNSISSCDSTEICEDLNPGIRCSCPEDYLRDTNSSCAAVSCDNSRSICDSTEVCEDLNPGILCVCPKDYIRVTDNSCAAISCNNSRSSCDNTEICEDTNPGIRCVCPKDYLRVSNSSCVAITCLNTVDMCNTATEICVDLEPGIRCVCREGYTRDDGDKCTPIPTTEMKENETTTETPENMADCPSEIVSIGGISLNFPLAKNGDQVHSNETCSLELLQNQTLSLATRVCNEVWEEPELQNCFGVGTLDQQLQLLSQMSLTDVNVGEFSRILALVIFQFDEISVRILELIIEYLARLVALGSASFEVTDAVIGIVSIIMEVNEEILSQAKGVPSVIPLLEEQITNVHISGQNYTQSLPNIDVSALQVPKMPVDDSDTFIAYSISISENAEDEGSVKETSITLPSSVLQLVRKVYPSITTVPVSFVAYQTPNLFRKDENQTSDNRNVTDEYIGSYVISSTIELPNVTISDLPDNSSVIIRFSDLTVNETYNDTGVELSCVYWKYTSESGEGQWSESGCMKLSSGYTDVTCSCNHLTSFAVLVRTYDEEETDFHLALQLISVLGCIISVVGLSISLVCMIILRTVREKQQTHVHFNLCLALLGLYLSFLFGIDQADQPQMCRIMTSVIYFFCLSSMAWMSVEAFYIYKLIWKSKQHNVKRLIPVGILFAWGLPGAAAVVIFFVDNTHDYVAEPDYCFLHPGHVLLYGFLLELFLLFLYNSIVFVLVTYRISCRRIRVWNKEERRQELVIRLKSTILFWLVLGISWIFGFLATFEQPTSMVFQIIFCVFLSLQGFFMFFLLIVQNPEMKKSLSSISTLRIRSASLQLGPRSSAAISTKKQSRQEIPVSIGPLNNATDV